MMPATCWPRPGSPAKSATAIGIGWKLPRRTSMTSSARAAVTARNVARTIATLRIMSARTRIRIRRKAECGRIGGLFGCWSRSAEIARIEVDHEVFPILVIGLELGRNTQGRAPSRGAGRGVRDGPEQRVGRRVDDCRIAGERAVLVEADAHGRHRRLRGALRADRRLPAAMQLIAEEPHQRVALAWVEPLRGAGRGAERGGLLDLPAGRAGGLRPLLRGEERLDAV